METCTKVDEKKNKRCYRVDVLLLLTLWEIDYKIEVKKHIDVCTDPKNDGVETTITTPKTKRFKAFDFNAFYFYVEMMGLIGMGNNPMVGATVAVSVAVAEAMK